MINQSIPVSIQSIIVKISILTLYRRYRYLRKFLLHVPNTMFEVAFEVTETAILFPEI